MSLRRQAAKAVAIFAVKGYAYPPEETVVKAMM